MHRSQIHPAIRACLYALLALGAFVMLVISAAVVFLMWYTVTRDAAEIQPLVPALQSWWMKIHVPANFIGYGSFALSAMVGVAWLLRSRGILASRLPLGMSRLFPGLAYFAVRLEQRSQQVRDFDHGCRKSVATCLQTSTKFIVATRKLFCWKKRAISEKFNHLIAKWKRLWKRLGEKRPVLQ